MLITLAGIVMLDKIVPKNAPSPILSSWLLFSKVIVKSRTQFWKANSPMLLTLAGMVIFPSLLQSSKA
jgi:hypothetical protein